MSLSPEGVPLLLGATTLAVVTYALALRLRSWPLWLAAFVFTLLILGISWAYRAPRTTVSLYERSANWEECARLRVCVGERS